MKIVAAVRADERLRVCRASWVPVRAAINLDRWRRACTPPPRANQRLCPRSQQEDPCCYRAGTRHGQILEYNDNIAAALKATGGGGGVFRTAAVVGNVHQVDYRCKVIVSAITSRPSLDADGMNIPFDILRGEPPVVGA